jgi:hypothetical protein
LLVVVLALVFLFDKRPFTLEAEQRSERAQSLEELEDETVSDYAVLLDPAAIDARTSEGIFDRSWVWVQTLRQELGGARVLTPDELSPEVLENLRVLVVSESAGVSDAVQQEVALLQSFAQDGGTLALELPTGRLRDAFAGDGEGGWRTASTLSAISGADETMSETLRAMPLFTRFLGNRRPLENSTTLLAMDGAPVAYSRPIGDGSAIVFDFRVAAQIATIEQGKPGDQMEVNPRKPGDEVHTSDLVADTIFMSSTIPIADELESWIVWHALGSTQPLVAFWPYPEGSAGALLSSHESKTLKGRPLWMSIHERELGARTTTFVAAPPPDDMPQDIQDPDMLGHAAMLWVMNPRAAGLQRQWGILGLHPVIQPLSLERQLDYLTLGLKTVSRESIHGIRSWNGRWSRHFTGAYRAMEALGFRYSASYGPAGDAPPGYLFGTCQPFRPIDANGSPFNLLETPICFINPTSEKELELLGQSLQIAVERAHSLHVLTSSDRFRTQPDLEQFDAWRDMLRFAERNEMWIGGAGQLVDFWNARQDARLRIVSRTVEARDDSGNPEVIRLVVECETERSGLSISLPEQTATFTLEQVQRGLPGTDARREDAVEVKTRDYRGSKMTVAPVPRGFSTYTVRYRKL